MSHRNYNKQTHKLTNEQTDKQKQQINMKAQQRIRLLLLFRHFRETVFFPRGHSIVIADYPRPVTRFKLPMLLPIIVVAF